MDKIDTICSKFPDKGLPTIPFSSQTRNHIFGRATEYENKKLIFIHSHTNQFVYSGWCLPLSRLCISPYRTRAVV